MESLLCEKWELQPKYSSTELQRWPDRYGVVKNPKRRFRFTANITKRYEAAQMRKTNQEKLRIAVLVSKAAFEFIKGAKISNYTIPDEDEAAGFKICAEGHDLKKLRLHGGVTKRHEAAQSAEPISSPTQQTNARSGQVLIHHDSSQLSSATNHRRQPYPIPPSMAAFPMAEEFVSAFHDLQNNATNNEKLVEFVRSYYVNNLNTPEFCSALKLHLNLTNNPIHEQPANDHRFIIVQNFFHDISRLSTNHQMMENALNSMNTNFTKHLHSIAVSKKVYSVLFNAATMICAVVAAIAAANVIPMGGWQRAGFGAVAAVASILFPALGKWHRSLLIKRETAVKKHKVITDHMITVARPIMTDLSSIYSEARSLEFQIKSLSEAVDGREKLAAVENCLLQNAEKYNSVMNLAKDLVLKSIFNQLD